MSSIFGDFVAGDNDVHVGGETSGCNTVLEYLTRGEERWQEGLMDPCSREGFVLAARNPSPPIPALSCVGGRFQYVPATAWPTVLNARFLNLASFPRILQITSKGSLCQDTPFDLAKLLAAVFFLPSSFASTLRWISSELLANELPKILPNLPMCA